MNVLWLGQTIIATAMISLAAWLADRVAGQLRWPRRWIWLAALTLTVGLPWLSLVLPWAHPVSWMLSYVSLPPIVAGVASVLLGNYIVITPNPVGGIFGSPTGGMAASGMHWTSWIFVASTIVTLAVVLALCVRWHVRLSRSPWIPATVDGVDVLVSPTLGPAVVGLVRPAVVVPAWLLGADPAERRLILRHEAEHLAAGDSRLLAVALLLVALAPWNLLVWQLFARLRAVVELDCDARVLRQGADPKRYAETLLRVSARIASVPILSVPLGTNARAIQRRIRAMTARVSPPHIVSIALSALIAVWAVSVAYELSAPARVLQANGLNVTVGMNHVNIDRETKAQLAKVLAAIDARSLFDSSQTSRSFIIQNGRVEANRISITAMTRLPSDTIRIQMDSRALAQAIEKAIGR